MKKNKTLLLTLLVTLLPVVLIAAAYPRLPETIATHWGTDGNPDGWSPRWFIFLLPLLLAVLHLTLHIAVRHGDPRVANVSHVMRGMTYWIIPILSVFSVSVIVCHALGMTVPVMMLVKLLFSCLFIFIGNYAPKCRQNALIGIRLPWTLNNVDNWNFTHRISGYFWMAGGAVMLISTFTEAHWLFTLVFIIMIVVPFAASLWHRARREHR